MPLRVKKDQNGKPLFTCIVLDRKEFTPDTITAKDMAYLSSRSAHLASFFKEEPAKKPKPPKDDASESQE